MKDDNQVQTKKCESEVLMEFQTIRKILTTTIIIQFKNLVTDETVLLNDLNEHMRNIIDPTCKESEDGKKRFRLNAANYKKKLRQTWQSSKFLDQ